MRLRAPAAAAIAALMLLSLFAYPRAGDAQETDLLTMTSTVTYDVKNSDAPIGVAWDVTLVNNDPATVNTGSGQIFFYDALAMPLLRGAASVTATDSAGETLDVTLDDPGQGVAVRAVVDFAQALFYQETYSFRLTYTIADGARSEGVVVTPSYAFLPVVAAGDTATVVVNTPAGDPWQVSLEAQACEQSGNSFTCSGSEAGYLAAIVEVSQPGAVSSTSFNVQLDQALLAVTLTYFQGEESSAQHQQEVITAGLPIIEDVYGFSFSGPAVLNVTHGGRQSVLGYEGLASCTPALACEVVIAPIADDYTVLHELSHLWSDIYNERWLSEGFAELVSRAAASQMPELVPGPAPERPSAQAELQLDEWGAAESLIGADDEQLARVTAGYDYSLRFMEELRDKVGDATLQATNRAIAAGGTPADSRRYFDALEEESGADLGAEFLLWVFPDGYDEVLADRREAKMRLGELRGRLTDQSLPLDITASIEESIRGWSFGIALRDLDEAEANLDTYAGLRGELDRLQSQAQSAGLVLPGTLAEDLDAFKFEDVRLSMSEAEDAVSAYASAEEAVDGPRSAWERFGLLGSDPDGELDDARASFESGDFGRSREHSEDAQDLIDSASSVAFRRLLMVAGFFGLLVLALAIAFAVSRLRERELAKD